MGTFKLSLPTDIPWRRICVSQDMLDPITCDDERPPRWRSSLAAFRYDPAEEYQPYEDEIVSYIKIVATLAPYQPDIDLGEFDEYVPPQPVFEPPPGFQLGLEAIFGLDLVEQLEESFPCYGAILQVSVGPKASDLDRVAKEKYPYIIDCEPKKRELYEAVSETGEVLAGSKSALTVGKAATQTSSVEDYDLDMGWSFSLAQSRSASVAGMGGGHEESIAVSDPKQVGTVRRSSREYSDFRMEEGATERRELQSHTTQLTQMYNLFQAFHLGTNRALFLMEPRPHVRQTEATFITGPRALEGVQEVFLVVVRPKVMLDFCVSALLETAHITKQLKEVPEERRDKLQPVRWGPGHHENVFYPDPDFVFDWDGKFAWSYGSLPDFFNVSNVKIGEEKAPGYLRVQVDVGEEGRWNVDLVLHMKSKRMALKEHARKMFLSARELCCCPPLVPVPPDRIPLPDWITSTSDLSRMRSPIYPGLMSRSRFAESRRLSAAIRDEMVRSLRSSGRQPRGKLRYVDSDAFHTRVADVLRISGRGERLRLSIANVRGLSDELRGRLYRARGSCTIDDVLTTDSTILARMLDIDLAQIGQLKAGLLREVGRIP